MSVLFYDIHRHTRTNLVAQSLEKMEFQTFLSSVIFLIIAGSYCMPVEKRFLVDCNEQLNCTDVDDADSMICGTDGNTYLGKCFLEMKNQERFCKVGNFNEIGISHHGNCTQDD